MSEFDAYANTFSRGVSPFVKWTLSPFLIIIGIIMSFQVNNCIDEGRISGAYISGAISIVCFCSLLGLWGVPHIGRVVTGFIALGFSAYVIDECFISYDGDFGIGSRRSETTPLNSILGFTVFGLPCLIYTIFGRFTFKKHKEDHPSET